MANHPRSLLCSTARKRNTKLAEGERQGGKDTFPSSVSSRRLLELGWQLLIPRAAASTSQPGKSTLCASSSLETTKIFSVIIFTLFRVLMDKCLNTHPGKPRTGGIFIVLAHLCQRCGSRGEQRPDILLCLSSSQASLCRGWECLTASSALQLPSSPLLLLSSRYFWWRKWLADCTRLFLRDGKCFPSTGVGAP